MSLSVPRPAAASLYVLTRRFLDQGMGRVRHLLKTHEDELHTLANALVEYETLDLDEVKRVLRGEKLNRVGTSGRALRSEQEKKDEADKARDKPVPAGSGPIVPNPVPQPIPVSRDAPREV